MVFLIFCSSSLSAKGNDLTLNQIITPLELNKAFNATYTVKASDLVDFVDREDKVLLCVQTYIQKQSKSYSKIVQENLFNLMHDFTNVVNSMYGKKSTQDIIPYGEKIEILAKIQCEAYYKMDMLK